MHCLLKVDGLQYNYLQPIHLEIHFLMKLMWMSYHMVLTQAMHDDVEDDSEREVHLCHKLHLRCLMKA